jgi:hypothetical protein
MRLKIILVIFIVFWGIIQCFVVVNAQDSTGDWTEAEPLYFVTDGLRSNYLSILTDQADKVYTWWMTFNAFTEAPTVDQIKSSTFHAQNIGGNWRSPTDVLISPDAGRMASVVIDSGGLLHAFFSTHCLNYVTAQHEQAMSARGWNNIGCLDKIGNAYPSAVNTVDGKLFVVYAAPGNHSYRLIHSQDGGSSWSAYRTVLEIQDNFLLDPMIAVDQKGRLHLVWSVGQAPDGYPPIGVFYSRSDNGGSNWTAPIQLGGLDEGEPAVAVFEDDVHVLWNGDAEKRGRYYRYSPDAGETWSPVEELSPPSSLGGEGGLQRPPAIVVDNVGNVHVLLHEQDALFYATKNNFGWVAKQALYNPELMKAVEIFGVRLAITGGSTLHALYILESYDRSIGEDRRNHIWRVFHQTTEINSIKTQPIPWPTSTPAVAGNVKLTPELIEVEPTPIENPYTILFQENAESSNNNNPAWPIFIGIISVSIFILSLFFLFFTRIKR